MSSVFSNPKCTQIRLTRDTDEENDDRILIRYKGEGLYQLFFKDGNTTGKKTSTYCTVLDVDELTVYLDSFFSLLSTDRDPFQTVEFQIPCFPCVQFSPRDLRNETVQESLKSLLSVLYSAARYS